MKKMKFRFGGEGFVFSRFFFYLCVVYLYIRRKPSWARRKESKNGFVDPSLTFSLCFLPQSLFLVFLFRFRSQPRFSLFYFYISDPSLSFRVCVWYRAQKMRERAWVERVVCYHMRVCEVSGPQSTCRWIVHCIYYSPSVECLCEIKLCKEFVS